MRKKREFNVDYYRGKEKKVFSFTIEMIPQSVLRDYTELAKVISDTLEKSNRLTMIKETKGEIVYNKDKDAKNKLDKLTEEQNQIIKDLQGIDHEQFFDKRYKLIKKLLEKNGIDDEYYLSREFWEDDVDSSHSATILENAIYKDIDETVKKKVKKK